MLRDGLGGCSLMMLVSFFLTVHLTIACLFVLTFAFVSLQEPSHQAPRWFTLAFASSATMPLLGFWIPVAAYPRLIVLASFAAIMMALTSMVIGLHKTYKQPPNWPLLGVLFAGAILCNALIFELPRASFLHRFLYQLPLCLVELLAIRVIYRSGMPRLVDKLLMVLAVLSFVHFFSKTFLIVWPGADVRPQDHSDGEHFLFSLSTGVFIHVATGLLLLLRTLSRLVGDASEQSEIDALSQIYNRRGFDRHVARILARNGPSIPFAVIMSDLDYFKRVNDTYGHDGGDRVIAAFGGLLKAHLPKSTIAARMGGEEFVAFLPGADMHDAHHLAQTLRTAMGTLGFLVGDSDWRPTASFGVAEKIAGESLYETMRRADCALYDAKKAGRNRVHMAEGQEPDSSRSTALQPISDR